MDKPLRAALFTTTLILISVPTEADPSLGPSSVQAVQLVTSANGSVQTVSREEAMQLYLGYRNRLSDGTPVTLIDLPAGPTRNQFYQQLIDKNPVQVRANWSRLVFSGRGRPPLEADSQNEAHEWLASTPNAIGYLPGDIHDSRLKILLVVPKN